MLCTEYKISSPHLSTYVAQADSTHGTLPPHFLHFNMMHAEYSLASLTDSMAVDAGSVMTSSADALYLIPSYYRAAGFTVPKIGI